MSRTTVGAVLLTYGVIAVPVHGGSGKHIPPLGQFSKIGVQTPAEAWTVVNQSYNQLSHFLALGELETLLNDADLMLDALGWLKKHRQEVFAPDQMEAGLSALRIADDIIDSVHHFAHRKRLEVARQYFALLREALRQIEIRQRSTTPLKRVLGVARRAKK